jgi:hypothetical protein
LIVRSHDPEWSLPLVPIVGQDNGIGHLAGMHMVVELGKRIIDSRIPTVDSLGKARGCPGKSGEIGITRNRHGLKGDRTRSSRRLLTLASSRQGYK